MIRNSKAFSLGLMAICAFGAFAAQGASAVPLTIDGPVPPTVFITSISENKTVFKTSGTIECTSSSYSSSSTPVSGAISEVTRAPTATGCVAFGFATSDIKFNGCTFTTTTPTDAGAGVVTFHPSQIHFLCPEGKKMDFTPTSFGVSVCTQSIGEQTPTSGHIVSKNVPGTIPMHMTEEDTMQGLHYTGTGGACGTSGTTGEITGNYTSKCYSDAAHTKQIGCTNS